MWVRWQAEGAGSLVYRREAVESSGQTHSGGRSLGLGHGLVLIGGRGKGSRTLGFLAWEKMGG